MSQSVAGRQGIEGSGCFYRAQRLARAPFIEGRAGARHHSLVRTPWLYRFLDVVQARSRTTLRGLCSRAAAAFRVFFSFGRTCEPTSFWVFSILIRLSGHKPRTNNCRANLDARERTAQAWIEAVSGKPCVAYETKQFARNLKR